MENIAFECKSSMDQKTRFKTILVFCLIMGIEALILLISKKYEDERQLIIGTILLIAVYAPAMTYGFLYTPYSYKLSSKVLIINRRRRVIKIPLKDIHVIREFGKEDRKGLLKRFGAEGIIGNLGKWSSNLHKSLNVITSRDTNWVLIRMKEGKKYIISPDNMELINKVNVIIKLKYGV